MVTTQLLHELSDVFKISVIAEKSGLKSSTLLSKLRDNRDLTTTESKKIEQCFYQIFEKIHNADKEFKLEDYENYSIDEVLALPEEMRNKIIKASAEQSKDDYEYIQDNQHIIEH
jgi:hypothetical protein